MSLISFLKNTLDQTLSLEDQKAFLLTSLEQLSAQDLAEAVRFFQSRQTLSLSFPQAIDVCGTGGSGKDRINTSTLSAFLLASMDIPVAKHGNKASSGRFGSFDLLEALEIDVTQPEKTFSREGISFLYAPRFHPDFKQFADARRAVGQPTFFNLLGPLLNPAGVQRQIIGTAFPDKMDLLAETCRLLERERVFIVHGRDGLDEITLTGPTDVVELREGRIHHSVISPEDFGIAPCSSEEISSPSIDFNRAFAEDFLIGNGTSRHEGRHRDLVLVNTALALVLTDRASSLKEAYQLVSEALAQNKTAALLQRLQTPSILLEIAEHKRQEVKKRHFLIPHVLPLSDRSFKAALHNKAIIAEIKYQSPSEGSLSLAPRSVADMARLYETNGAAAISVLCDSKYFKGNLSYLTEARQHTNSIPLLCKDFILEESQIHEARAYGADAILLIAALLTETQIQKFLTVARSLNMDALCEVHTPQELEKILHTDAEIIGINNRNLHNFTMDLSTTTKLLNTLFPEQRRSKKIVCESGVYSFRDIPEGVDAALVGSALMKSAFPELKLKELLGKPLLKICGIREVEEAQACERLRVDFVGFNFVAPSRRCIPVQKAALLRAELKQTKAVGIFQNQSIEEVNSIAKTLNLDFIQLSGNEDQAFIDACVKPVIKTIQPKELASNIQAEYLLVDGPHPGSGNPANSSLLSKNIDRKPFLLAGGVTPDNAWQLLKTFHPIGLDVASGVETNGRIELQKICTLVNLLSS